MAVMANAKPVVVETTPQEGFLLTVEKLKAAITPKSRVIILCSPSNPTGAMYPRLVVCSPPARMRPVPQFRHR